MKNINLKGQIRTDKISELESIAASYVSHLIKKSINPKIDIKTEKINNIFSSYHISITEWI
jgi:hypothetical protein